MSLHDKQGYARNRRTSRYSDRQLDAARKRSARPYSEEDSNLAPRDEADERSSYRMPPETLEDRPARARYDDRDDDRYDDRYDNAYFGARRKKRWPLVVLCVVLAIAVLLAALFLFVPEGDTGVLGALNTVKTGISNAANTVYKGALNLVSREAKPAAQVYTFQTAQEEGLTGVKYTFYITANSAAEDIRIEDANGREMVGTLQNKTQNNTSSFTYTVDLIFDAPFRGELFVSAFNGEAWVRSDKSMNLIITAPTATPVLTPTPTIAPTATLAPATDVPAPVAVVTAPPATIPPIVTAPPVTLAPTDAPVFVPTQAPTIVPVTLAPITQAPTATPTLAPTQAPTDTPEPTNTPMPILPVEAADAAKPEEMGITEKVFVGTKSTNPYTRETPISMPSPDEYMRWPGGVLTFRGDSFRRNAASGTAEIFDEEMEIVWQTPLGSLRTADSGTLYGVGWTGQPAIVRWSKQARQMMNIHDEKKATTSLKEVIFAGLDGNVYFLDLADGAPTRDPIDIGYPLKGSVMVDTFGMPFLAVGQAISKLPNKTGDIGYYVYNLIDQKRLTFLDGRQKSAYAYSTNGAFDGTGLFVHTAQNDCTLVVAGENGLLYTVRYDVDFKYELDEETDLYSGTLAMTSETVMLKSKAMASQDKQTSVESSVAMYDKYVYLADAYGALRCVDTDSMQTVWAANVDDNTDAAIALDFDEDGSLALYTGNTRLRKATTVKIRRFDALTGEEAWAYPVECEINNDQLSGCKASPVIGQHSISDLVIFTVNMLEEGGATMLALDKQTGNLVWQYALPEGAISSPVAVYDESGEAWIVQGDSSGNLHLLVARTGALRYTLALGGEIEASPAVYNDLLLIGTCSKDNANMYCVRIK